MIVGDERMHGSVLQGRYNDSSVLCHRPRYLHVSGCFQLVEMCLGGREHFDHNCPCTTYIHVST